jgi:adenylate cyclase
MGIEIERKFLVRVELLPQPLPEGDDLEQGYLAVDPAVRVRVVTRPDGTRHAELTVKGKGLLSRAEFNYPIPPADAEAMMTLCSRSLRKLRRRIGPFDVDHFRDRDLWLAEIELRDEREEFERPAWLGDEVTDDARYSNARLASPRPAE